MSSHSVCYNGCSAFSWYKLYESFSYVSGKEMDVGGSKLGSRCVQSAPMETIPRDPDIWDKVSDHHSRSCVCILSILDLWVSINLCGYIFALARHVELNHNC